MTRERNDPSACACLCYDKSRSAFALGRGCLVFHIWSLKKTAITPAGRRSTVVATLAASSILATYGGVCANPAKARSGPDSQLCSKEGLKRLLKSRREREI